MDLANPVEIVMHYLLIRWKTCLSHQDEFLMVSVLVCMVTHWIRLAINHNVRLSIVMIHQATILHGLLTLSGY